MTVMTTEPTETEVYEPDAEELALVAQRQRSALMAKLKEAEAAERIAAAGEWATLVLSYADGKVGDFAEMRAVLKRAGKTAEDLDEAVADKLFRRQKRRELDAGKAAEAVIQRCQRELQAVGAEYREITREFEEKERKIITERDAALTVMSQSFSAKTELIDSASPEALAVTDKLNQRMEQIRQESASLKQTIDDKRRALHMWTVDGDAGYAGDIARVTAEVAEMDAQLDGLRTEAGEINDRYLKVELDVVCNPEWTPSPSSN